MLLLALITVPDPLRLIATFLVISRPRPAQNLFAYWTGAVILNGSLLVVPLIVLHFTPSLRSFVQALASPTSAGGATVQPLPFALGIVSLVIAVLLTYRIWSRRRVSVPVTSGGTTDETIHEPDPPPASRFDGIEDWATEGTSALRRMLGRLFRAWTGGSLWVSLLMGLTYSPVQVSIALTIIAASAATLGTQLLAAITFVVIMLALVEIVLVSYLIAPVNTEAVIRPIHDWAQAHTQQLLAGMSALAGVFLVVQSLGLI